MVRGTNGVADWEDTVCVSALMVQEIKRIIKDSEIIKYAALWCFSSWSSS